MESHKRIRGMITAIKGLRGIWLAYVRRPKHRFGYPAPCVANAMRFLIFSPSNSRLFVFFGLLIVGLLTSSAGFTGEVSGSSECFH